MLAVHTAAAFHFAHGWSHAAAYDHTAMRTAEVVGLNWGGGIWFNEAALIFWGVDVLLLWMFADAPPKNRVYLLRAWHVGVHSFLAMMFVSATVVFGPAHWWIAAAVFLGIVAAIRLMDRLATPQSIGDN